jgi:hypothetical protein
MHLPPKTQWFLTKEQCENAIGKWELERTDFSKIQQLINPTHVFYFSEEGREWIKQNNDFNSFHAYAGVYEGKFYLIIRPLDRNGKPKPLEEYLAVGLQPLNNELTLVETDVVTTVSKTVLSKNLEIIKDWKEVDLPVYNEPTITERASVKDIESWKYDCLSWFYNEVQPSKGGGKNIFKAFSVPFADLDTEADKNEKVIALFGLKFSSVFQKMLPVLIFVADSKENNTSEIMRQNQDQGSLSTNTRDWSTPWPPGVI